MKSKFIFLVIFTTCFNRSISLRPYFADDDLGEEDPIEEWKDIREIENDPANNDLISNIKNDLSDYDYRNGNFDYRNGNFDSEMEDQRNDRMKNNKKRETKTIKDMQQFSDADIEQALKTLSEGELQVLEQLMENEAETSKVEKREILQNKRFSSKYDYKSNSKDSDEFDDEKYNKELTYEQLPDTAHKARRLFKRYNRFGPLTREEILQARIDFLKDNYKRQSEIGKIENSFKPKERYKRETTKSVFRNPYFNTLIGPRSRTKRSVDKELNVTKNVNPMDDPKSDEHIKLLEESFPNPDPANSLESDQSHIRVKRS